MQDENNQQADMQGIVQPTPRRAIPQPVNRSPQLQSRPIGSQDLPENRGISNYIKPVELNSYADSGVVTDEIVPDDSINENPTPIITTMPTVNDQRRLRPGRGLLWGIACLVLLFGLLAGLFVTLSFVNDNEKQGDIASSQQYPLADLPLVGMVQGAIDELGQLSQITLNGRVKLNGSLVLSPTETPPTPTTGELYYDRTTGSVAYYNGSEFKALVTNQQVVSSVGGVQGNIALGQGLQLANNTIVLTNPPATTTTVTTPTPTPTPVVVPTVTSLQGQTGSIVLNPGTGIAITGTTITNGGVTQFAGLTGAILTGKGITLSGNVVSSSVSIASGSSDLSVTDDGNGNYTITNVGSGMGGTVALGPVAPQTDNSTNPSIALDKTNTGNLMQLKVNGTDAFVVDNTGNIATGTIAYSQVTGRPTSTVQTLGGSSGDIAVGSGLALIGNVLSSTGSGIASVAGTTNQVNVATNSGIATISLPQDIATNSNVSFNTLTLGTALTIANGGTGATTASQARTNLSAAVSGANGDITSLTNLTAITPIAGLTIGATTQNLTLQGSTTSLSTTNGSFTTTLNFATPTANNTVTIPNQGGTVCLSTGNCLGGASGGASTSLNNLSSVAINTSLLPGTTTIDLGSSTNPFRDIYLGGTATNNYKLTGSATASRTITLPDQSGTVCLTTGNCAGAGGGITGLGTADTIAMFDGTGTIANSILTQDAGATTLTVTGDLNTTGNIYGNGANITNLSANNVASGTLAIARGGTGTGSTPTNGQLLIGNGTGYSLATIQAGSNITVTNTAGGISIGANIPATGANTSLSNLSAVALNTSLIPAGAGINLGSAAIPFTGIYIGTGANNTLLQSSATQARAVSLPDESGTICFQGSASCGFAVNIGSVNYIQNQYTGPQATSNYWLSGTARADTSVLTPSVDTAAAGTLSVGTTNATGVTIGRAASTTTLAGTLTATGSSITLGTVGSSQIINNGAVLNTALALSDFPTGGAIGTAAATVNIYASFTIAQTTAGQTLVMPSPTNTAAGRVIYVSNTGSTTFTMAGTLVNAGSSATMVWNGSAWNIVGASTGVAAVGTLDGQAKNANGATISGNSIYLQTADATNAGLVSTGSQTIAGAKTFTSLLSASGGFSSSGAATNINASSNFATNINTGTSTGIVTIGGSSLVAKNTANTTSAFQVQNAAGTSILNVDTTNQTLNVGTAATFAAYGAGASFAGKVDYATGTAPQSLTSSDVNSDGKPDIITPNNTANTVSVFINNGNGTFAAKVDYATGKNPQGVTTADVNGDSKPDIITANFGAGNVSVFINNGNGTFAAKVDYTVGTGSQSVSANDINGDGKPDILVATQGSCSGSGLAVLINNGDGTFAPKIIYGGVASCIGTGIATADFNGDGKYDVIIDGGIGNNTKAFVYINNGDGTFPVPISYTTGTDPYSVVTADFNSDTKPDFATVNYNSNTSSVFINNGNGTFAAKVDYTTGTNPYSITSADVNADGKPDIISSNGTSTTSVLINNGNGTFAAKVDYATGTTPRVTAADVNADGKPDIITANQGSNTISVLMNSSTLLAVKSNLSTTITSTTQAGYILQSVAGQTADILRVQDSLGTPYLSIGGNGNVGIGGVTNSTYKLDVNGSANIRADLYVGGIKRIDAAGNLYNINSYSPIGNVLFQNQVNSTTAFQVQNSSAANMLSVDTVNRKITVGTAGASQLTNNGSTLNTAKALGNYATGGSIGTAANTVDYYTTFTIPQTTASQTLTLPSPTVTTAGRIIYIINTGSTGFNIGTNYIANGSTATYIWNGTTWVASQAGLQGVTQVGALDGQAKNANGATIAGTSIYMQTADATNPGLVSTTTQTFAGAKTFSSLLTASAGANISGAATNINVGSNFATNINTGGSTGAVTIGGSSLIAKNTANTTSGFQVQNAAGTSVLNVDTTNQIVNVGTAATYTSYTVGAGFAAPVYYNPSLNVNDIITTDVNKDGKSDIITANNGFNTASVLINNGNGTFATKVDYTTGASPYGITTADLNGDGNSDIITTNNGASTVSVLMNNGNGTFAAKVDYATGSGTRGVTTADVNGDGMSDIMVANQSSNNISVLMNNGNGTFATKVDYTVGSQPFGVASADFNADGKPDIVAANAGSLYVSVLFNNGNGTFAAKVDYATGSGPYAVTTDDVNGDSKPDIISVNNSGNTTSVLINNGNGTFATKVDYTTSNNPLDIDTADVNSDGNPDIIVASSSSGARFCSVFYNNGNGTFAAGVSYSAGGTSGTYPSALTVDDLNSDGKPDIIAGNSSWTYGVDVFMNGSTITSVKSNLSTTVAGSTQAGYILQSTAGQTADILRVQDSTGMSIMAIGSTGNVGLGGVTNSSYKLDVNGSANIRAELYVGGIKRIDAAGNLYNVNNYSPIGNVLFQNQVNSTNSFQIQNALAANMLSVDTTNRKITVGTAGASQLTNNGSTLNTAKALGNYASGGSIGTADTTVDYYTTFTIPQTTASQTLTLPSPTVTTAGRIIYIVNTGSTGFNIGTNYIANGSTATYIWNGTTWIASQAGLQGVTQVGALDGQAKNANGATIAGTSIYLQTADATNPGLVSTTNQTFAGAKTFSSLLTANAGANISGAATNINVGSNFATNINTGTSTGNVTVGGNSVLFKNTANSTGAFVIQNSAGTALFTADTTGMKVTVTALTVSGDLTVNGHIITGGSNPTKANGAAACTTPTITVTGNDTAGTVSITTGSGCASTGVLTTITFASAFATTPRVSLSPTNSNAANLKYYNGTAGTASFTIDTNTVPTNSTLYTYSYFITQ